MAGWHHRLDGCEFEWTQGVGDGQGGLAGCNSWGCKESDMTEQLNWTDCGRASCIKPFPNSLTSSFLTPLGAVPLIAGLQLGHLRPVTLKDHHLGIHILFPSTCEFLQDPGSSNVHQGAQLRYLPSVCHLSSKSQKSSARKEEKQGENRCKSADTRKAWADTTYSSENVDLELGQGKSQV